MKQKLTVNGVDFIANIIGNSIALFNVNQPDDALIEATIDHAHETIDVDVYDGGHEEESVNYFEFRDDVDGLIEWMANRLFD